MNNLLILGAGQYGSVVKEIAQSLERFDEIKFLDDAYGSSTEFSSSLRDAIGRLDDFESFAADYAFAIPALGDPEIRLALIRRIEAAGLRVPVLASPRAYVSPSARLESGVVVEPLAGVHANAVVKTGTYVSMGAKVNHDAVVGEGCHIDVNAVVMSGAIFPAKTKAFVGSVVRRESSATLTSEMIG